MNANKIKIGLKLIATVCLVVVFSLQSESLISNSFADADKSLFPAIKRQEKGEYPEAITKYYNIIEEKPRNLKAYYNLAIIIEVVLADYNSAILLYDKAISIAENKIAFFNPGQGGEGKGELNNLLSKLKKGREEAIQKMFNSIDGITFPRYIVLKPGKSVSSQPFAKSDKLETSLTDSNNEFQLINLKNNWYHLVLPTGGESWVNGNDVRIIYRNSNERRMTTGKEKAELYKGFTNSFPEHELVKEAVKRMNKLSN